MPISTAAFEWVCTVLRSDAAIVLEPGKEYLVESRLAPLARLSGKADVSTFVEYSRSTADRRSRDDIVEALTTNETSWFRDSQPFVALETEILPKLSRSVRGTRNVRIWSAACSTGQEPYSIGMIVKDSLLGTGAGGCEILATDIAPGIIAQAQRGTYTQGEVNRGLPAMKLVKHFSKSGMHWQINEDIRKMVTFRQLNLAHALPAMGQFDVVFLRNVLIYFSVETRREILQRIRAVCRPDAYLLLGGAETTIGVDDSWVREQIGRVPVYRPR
ncbi:chemotaxis protein methyltransferase CheR [Frankineae bacterium MT45]|nr:chemotaxis protein methyltransferase CheR [Frankineae bacterium MT45]